MPHDFGIRRDLDSLCALDQDRVSIGKAMAITNNVDVAMVGSILRHDPLGRCDLVEGLWTTCVHQARITRIFDPP